MASPSITTRTFRSAFNLGFDDPFLHRERADAEERFQFQRRIARARELAERNGDPRLLADVEESRIDYGMALESKGILFNEWKTRPEFTAAAYAFDGSAVVFRGVEFRTGDILLCNRARGSDGMFTTLVEGRQSFAHVATYVLLESGGVFYPAVVEIHYQGVRAIPLKVYLSQSFSTYIETYRSHLVTDDVRRRMAAIAREMLGEVHGFDIYLDDTQDVFLTCAQTAAQLYRRAGLPQVEGRSRYSLKTLPNLEKLGITSCAHRDLLMPDDYAKSEMFRIVGVVDNGKFTDLVARALVRERMQAVWQYSVLCEEAFPARFKLYHLAVKIALKRERGLATLLAKATGFPVGSFPSGPVVFIALTPIVEERIDRAAAVVANGLVDPSLLMRMSTWDEIAEHSTVRTLVTEAMSDFERLYAPKSQDGRDLSSPSLIRLLGS